MKRFWGSVLFLLLAAVPLLSYAAGLVPCGGRDEPACQTCYLVQLVNGVISWLVMILGTIAAIIIVYAGFKLVTSGGNRHAKEEAKSLITNMIIGYVIVLAGWLMIDTGMKMLLTDGETRIGPWNQLSCRVQPGATTGVVTRRDSVDVNVEEPGSYGTGSTGGGVSGGGGGGGASDSGGGARGTGSGTCSVVTDTNNACHPSRLTCFPDRNLASEICNLESRGGNTGILSGTDLCQDGRSFSVGLWQINILANSNLLPGCRKPFFTSSNGGQSEGSCVTYRTNSKGKRYCQFRSCRITNVAMYNTCVAAARNPANNTQAACTLIRSQGWSAWQTSYNACR